MHHFLNLHGRRSLVAAALVGALLAGCVGSADQTTVLGLMNKERARVGRHALHLDVALSAKAQRWADHLAATGTMSHSDLAHEVPSCARAYAQNIGYNPSLDQLEAAWIADVGINPPIHRINIRSDSFDAVGIGVTQANGQYWVVVDFIGGC